MTTRCLAPLAAALLAVSLAACSDSGSAPAAAAKNATPVDAATAGTITVAVGYSGAAPAPKAINMAGVPACAALHPEPVLATPIAVLDGRLANAVVYIQSGFGERGFAPPTEPVVVDQKGCLYNPRVTAVMIGQPLQFLNSDAEGHNVHGKPTTNDGWNFSMNRPGSNRAVTLATAELGIPVGCDIHPWMRAYISVFDNPYFAVTAADGAAILRNVPPGTYVLGVWHETLGILVKPVTLPPSGSVTVDFQYQPPS